MDHEKRVLSNGVRVLVAEMPETRSASITVFVGAGSRMETRADAGTGHFLEHIVFKGTAKRPTAAEISQVIESKGGVVNAATDKEVTVFWSRVPARHWKVALDVVADLIRAPMLRPADVDMEKRVVIEELRMYRDQPQDRVHTIIDELLYPKHPLGWEVAGREPVINALTADALRDFMRRGYVASKMVVAVAGKVDAEEVFAAVEELFADVETRTPPKLSAAPEAGKIRMKLLGRRTEQAHVVLAWRAVPQEHPDKYALDMLNAILGEGMSSRLFLELREKRALAYDVHSYGTNFVDAGHMAIYAGVTPERITEVIEASLEQVAKMRETIVPEDEIERVRDFNKGRLELRLEDSRGVSNWLAGQELFLDRVRSVEEVCEIIDSISAADVQRVARQYLKPELSYVAAVGPRAAIASVRVPNAEIVDMEIAS
ncbi:MAG TPA: pitrilysin family protein [Candidatus Limnocylindrales bacterium]|nr:pitrilysin family protein [Candidatus Limnocylindrales bacterium]